MQESPGRNPEWLDDDDKLFSSKNLYSLLNKNLSKILMPIESKKTAS